MTSGRFQRVRLLMEQAWELPPAERDAFLVRSCGDDAELLDEVRALLALDAGDDEALLDRPPARDELAALDESPPLPGDGARGALQPGQELDGFRIVRLIARGGMGVVYEAEQTAPRRRVALKVLRPGWLSAQLLRRFQREADVLGALRHPGIAQIHASGTLSLHGEDQPYLVMELVEGLPLSDHAAERRLDQRARVQLLARVCDAVQHAHDRGVVHRDLKPANILVAGEGDPKVLDFGIAGLTGGEDRDQTLLTQAGQVLGTLPYVSPEQVSGEQQAVDARSDVYSLGVLLYELLSGRRPLEFGQAGLPEAVRRIAEEEPTRLGLLDTRLAGDLETIARKALEKDPRRRYASASALADDLRRYLGHAPILAHPPSALYQVRKFARRHRGLVGGLVLAFVALAAGLAVAVHFGRSEAAQRAVAERSLYRLSLEGANAALERGEARLARGWLQDAPAELRGWEWQHLQARLFPRRWSTPVWAGGTHPSAAPVSVPVEDAGGARLASTPDGEVLVGFVDGRTLGEWDVHGGALLRRLPFEQTLVPTVLAVNETTVALADLDGQLHIVDRKLWQVRHSESLDGQVRAADWHPDGQQLLLGLAPADGSDHQLLSGPPGALRPFALSPAALYDVRWAAALDAVLCVFDPAYGNRFYTQAILLDATTGESLSAEQLPGKDAFGFAVANEGRLIVSGSIYRVLQLWTPDRQQPAPEPQLLEGHLDASITGIDISPDGRWLVSASRRALRVWDGHTGEARGELLLTGGLLCDVVVDPRGRWAAVSQGGQLSIYPLQPTGARVLSGHDTYAYWLDVSPDGHTLLSQEFSGRSALWDPASGRLLTSWPAEPSRAEPPWHVTSYHLAFDRTGERVLSWDHGLWYAFDPAADQAWRRIGGAHTPDNTSPVSQHLLWQRLAGPDVSSHRFVVSADGSLFHDAASSRVIHVADQRAVELDGAKALHTNNWNFLPNHTASFSPDGRRLLRTTLHADVYRVSDGAHLAALDDHDGQVYSGAWSPDGTRLATGGNDKTVRLWDGQTYEPLLVLSGHTQYVHDLVWGPDGSWLASAGGDGTVRIWDTLPEAERVAAAQALDVEMAARRPGVQALLDELGDPLAVAAALRTAPDLDATARRAALRSLRALVSSGE